jgi:alpha-L-rhamnosidase
VWERWDSFTKEHGFNGAGGNQNASMNSFSHYSFGAVMQWGFQHLAGIDTHGPAFKEIVIKPQPPTPGSNPDVKPIDWVKASYNSARGTIESKWKREGDRFVLEIMIPANTSAMVFVPATSAEKVTEGGKALGEQAKLMRFEDGRAVVQVGSGRYRFEVRGER